MNARFNDAGVLRAAMGILGVVGLAGAALICAVPTRAQSKPAQQEVATASSAVAAYGTSPSAQAGAAPTSAQVPSAKSDQVAARNLVAKKAAPKGQSEGIKVHGHWVIEVKNPDGKLVSRTEFENALSPGFPFPIIEGLTAQVPGGASFLSALMAGQAVITPGNWAVLLEGPAGLSPITTSPCVTASTYGACFIFSASTVPNFFAGQLCSGGVPAGPGLSCNLTVTPLGTGQNFTGFQFAGSVAAENNGTVSSVATMNFNACGTLSDCPFTVSAVNDGIVALTARNLDGNTPAGAAAGDPNPVTVTAGQTISVTVTISFQ
jgi:hypothetical protein